MSYTHALSKREKSLAIVGVALLLVLLVVGYAKATVGTAGILVSQEAVTPATPTDQKPIDDNDRKNQEDNFKNWQRNVKDRGSEIKNIWSDIKKTAPADATQKADILLGELSKCVAEAGQLIGTSDFWNKNNDCSQAQRNLEDELRDNLYLLRDCYNNKRNIEDRKKEKKSNLDRQLKDIRRNNKSDTDLETQLKPLTDVVAQIDTQFAKADAITCTGTDADAPLMDVSSELNDLFRSFYDSSNEVNQAANEGRQLQDNIRDYEKDKKLRCEKDKTRELKNFRKEVVKAGDSAAQTAYDIVNQIYGQMCTDALGAMKTALDKKDTDAYNEARSAYDELDRTFWDTMNESRQGVQEKRQKAEQLKNVTRDLKQKTKDLKRMKTALKRAETSFNKVASKYLDKGERQQAKKELQAYIAKANELVTSMNAGLMAADQAVKDGDVDTLDEYWSDQQDLDDMRGQFDELQRSAQFIPELIKQLANVEKELSSKKLARERNSLPEELKPQFDELVSNINQSASNAWSVLVSDPDAAAEELQSIQMANQDWYETRNAWYEENQGEEEEPRATLPYFK